MGEVDALFRPCEGQAHVELSKVKVECLEAGNLTVELCLGGGRNHHGIVDAFAINGFADWLLRSKDVLSTRLLRKFLAG